MSSDGEVQGVGLLIASDPSSGRLVVLAPIIGGPADRAGMRPGDEVQPNLDNSNTQQYLNLLLCRMDQTNHHMLE